MDDVNQWDLFIIKWLYLLSKRYPNINDVIICGIDDQVMNNGYITLYADFKEYGILRDEIDLLINVTRDLEKPVKYGGVVSPTIRVPGYLSYHPLSHFFDKFRKYLRDYDLNNLLDDE